MSVPAARCCAPALPAQAARSSKQSSALKCLEGCYLHKAPLPFFPSSKRSSLSYSSVLHTPCELNTPVSKNCFILNSKPYFAIFCVFISSDALTTMYFSLQRSKLSQLTFPYWRNLEQHQVIHRALVLQSHLGVSSTSIGLHP